MYAVVQGRLTFYVLHAGIVYSQILLMNREDKINNVVEIQLKIIIIEAKSKQNKEN